MKASKFDTKKKLESLKDINERSQRCIRWFQKSDENHVVEKEKLCSELDAAEKRCTEKELEMKNKETELSAIISDLKERNASLHEKITKEEVEKMDVLDRYRIENETRVAAEKSSFTV